MGKGAAFSCASTVIFSVSLCELFLMLTKARLELCLLGEPRPDCGFVALVSMYPCASLQTPCLRSWMFAGPS